MQKLRFPILRSGAFKGSVFEPWVCVLGLLPGILLFHFLPSLFISLHVVVYPFIFQHKMIYDRKFTTAMNGAVFVI